MKEMIKKYWLEFKDGTKLMFKEFFNKETNKKQRANMWTFSRLVISFLIPICSLVSILLSNPILFISSIFITSFGALTDFFDGRSARKYNSFSEYGKVLDQIADKTFSFMIGINLSLFNPLFLLSLLGESLIAITNISYKLKYNNLNIKSTMVGKIKQWPLFLSLILGFLSIFLPNLILITNISIVLTNLFQLATTVSYIKNNNDNIKNLKEKIVKPNESIELKKDKSKDKDKRKANYTKQNQQLSTKDELIALRDLLKCQTPEIADKVEISLEEKGFQKSIKK